MSNLTVNLLFGTLVFWIAARIYLLPKPRYLDARSVLLPILLLHSLRHLGLMFLALCATYPGNPDQILASGMSAVEIRRAVLADVSDACSLVRRSIVELWHIDHRGDASTIDEWLENKTEANFARWISSDKHENEASTRGIEELTLVSSMTALSFYERCGYLRAGDPIRGFGISRGYPLRKRMLTRPSNR